MEIKLKAVILAAGAGSRLYPITLNKPKCMVKVGGRFILDYQIRAYSVARIEEIIIVGGFKINQIKKYCEKIRGINIKIIENGDYQTTNNMYSLYLAKEELEGNGFLLSNGDVIFDPRIVINLVRSKISDSIVCDKRSKNEKHMMISINDSGYMNDIDINIPSSIGINSVSILKFSPRYSKLLFEEISNIINEENDLNVWFEIALKRLLKSKQLIMYPFDVDGKRWVEIDTYADLIIAKKLFRIS